MSKKEQEFKNILSYESREKIKAEFRRLAANENLTIEERLFATEVVLFCLYARSKEVCPADSHPSFSKYISMLLNQYADHNVPSDLKERLLDRYGTSAGMSYGTCYIGWDPISFT